MPTFRIVITLLLLVAPTLAPLAAAEPLTSCPEKPEAEEMQCYQDGLGRAAGETVTFALGAAGLVYTLLINAIPQLGMKDLDCLLDTPPAQIPEEC